VPAISTLLALAGEAHRAAQFPGLRVLPARDVDGLLHGRLGLAAAPAPASKASPLSRWSSASSGAPPVFSTAFSQAATDASASSGLPIANCASACLAEPFRPGLRREDRRHPVMQRGAELLKEVVWRLVTEGRISYRRIKLSFALDDAKVAANGGGTTMVMCWPISPAATRRPNGRASRSASIGNTMLTASSRRSIMAERWSRRPCASSMPMSVINPCTHRAVRSSERNR
jgi:hypothetical protein